MIQAVVSLLTKLHNAVLLLVCTHRQSLVNSFLQSENVASFVLGTLAPVAQLDRAAVS